MNALEAGFEAGIEPVWAESVDGKQPLGPAEPATWYVPLPAAHLCHAFGLRQLLAAVAKLAFHRHRVGDVSHDDAATRLSALGVEDPRAYLRLDQSAVAPDHPGDAANAAGAFALRQKRNPALIGRVGQALTTNGADLSFASGQDLARR